MTADRETFERTALQVRSKIGLTLRGCFQQRPSVRSLLKVSETTQIRELVLTCRMNRLELAGYRLPDLTPGTTGDEPGKGMDGLTENGEKPTKRAAISAVGMVSKELHLPIKEQHQKLKQKLRGHYGYYGIIGNYASLQEFREAARGIWRRRLSRRRRDGDVTWSDFAWSSDTVFPALEWSTACAAA